MAETPEEIAADVKLCRLCRHRVFPTCALHPGSTAREARTLCRGEQWAAMPTHDPMAPIEADEAAVILRLEAREKADQYTFPDHTAQAEWKIAALIDRQAATIAEQAAEIGRLRAGGCARDQTTTQYCAEAVGLRKENDALRALAAVRGCVYGYQNPAGVCSLGYPGCACMDDLVATMVWSPEDEGRAATKRLLDRAVTAEAEIERLRAELSAATGYMLNAKIDLETGAPKRTAITTIEGGLRRARAALPPADTMTGED